MLGKIEGRRRGHDRLEDGNEMNQQRLEALMLRLKLQYFGHLMGKTDSLEKTLMLGKIEGGRRRE